MMTYFQGLKYYNYLWFAIDLFRKFWYAVYAGGFSNREIFSNFTKRIPLISYL